MNKPQLETARSYTTRYIISSCMQPHDFNYVKDASKTINWKRSLLVRGFINPEGWRTFKVLTTKEDRQNISNVKLEKNKEDNKYYLLITCEENDMFAISARKETIYLFYTGISLILNKAISNPECEQLLAEKDQGFEKMIQNANEFLTGTIYEPEPPIPKDPDTLPSDLQ